MHGFVCCLGPGRDCTYYRERTDGAERGDIALLEVRRGVGAGASVCIE
jgi:hypothetical protein